MKITPPSLLSVTSSGRTSGRGRIEPAVVPIELDRRLRAARGELVVNRRRDGIRDRLVVSARFARSRGRTRIGRNPHRSPLRRCRFDARRIRQSERPVRMIDQMRAHVAERADTEVDPAAPVERVIDRVIRDIFRDRSDVEIPVQSRRHRIGAERRREQLVHVAKAEWIPEWARRSGRRRRAGGPRNSLRPVHHRAIRPDVNLPHGPDDSGLYPFVDEARAFARVALISHLRHDLRIRERQVAKDARFVHGIRERLLHVHVLAALHRGLRGDGVQVIRRRDHDAVDVLLLVEHLAEIRVARGLVELFLELQSLRPILLLVVLQLLGDFALRVAKIDVGERHEILRLRQLERVLRAHPAKADDRKVDRVARRLKSHSAQNVARHDHHAESDFPGVRDELAPRDLLASHLRAYSRFGCVRLYTRGVRI